MGILDSPLRDLASTLISTFVDTASTLVRVLDSGDDPVTGETFPAAIQPFSVKTTPPENYKLHEIDGTAIQKSDLRLYIAAKDIAISPSPRTDTLNLGGLVLNIIKVSPHYSGDQVCLWEMQVRA